MNIAWMRDGSREYTLGADRLIDMVIVGLDLLKIVTGPFPWWSLLVSDDLGASLVHNYSS